MGLELNYHSGQSPLDEEEIQDLMISTISTMDELDEFEQANIQQMIEWSLQKVISIETILTIDFIKEVHRRMFNEVWNWAGKFRASNKNIGIDKYYIQQELTKLCQDCSYWINHAIYSPDEIAVRFKHRLVQIHPFPNGNGRHSRLMADILIEKGLHGQAFSWGKANLQKKGESRRIYLACLYQANEGNIKPLLDFARS